jgi:hypothetical protein
MMDSDVCARIPAVEAQAPHHEMTALFTQLLQENPEFARISSAIAEIPAIRAEISALRHEFPSSHSIPIRRAQPPPSCRWLPHRPPAGFTSLIISEFPMLFADFAGNQFSLLWRGSRHGFRARDFHHLCDGHANTLTLILDTNGNIFGGFTPVPWEGGSCKAKGDPTFKSFIFTLKNPHNFPARKFPLKPECKDTAVFHDSTMGPMLAWVIQVCDPSIAKGGMTVDFGDVYANDTGVDGKTLLTGSKCFTLKEIEVFKITD